MSGQNFTYREEIIPADRQKILALLNAADYFLPREIAYATDLFDEHLKRGDNSPYRFILQERDGMLFGYGCYGPIRFSDRRYHLHWMIIDKNLQKQGLGSQLETVITDKIRSLGGVKIFGTVSNRTWEATKAFYESCGYKTVASLPEYYGEGDNMVVCLKDLVFR